MASGRRYSLGSSALPLPGSGGATGVGSGPTYRRAAPPPSDASIAAMGMAAAPPRGRWRDASASPPAANSPSYPTTGVLGSAGTGAARPTAHARYPLSPTEAATRAAKAAEKAAYAAELQRQVEEAAERKRRQKEEQTAYERQKLMEAEVVAARDSMPPGRSPPRVAVAAVLGGTDGASRDAAMDAPRFSARPANALSPARDDVGEDADAFSSVAGATGSKLPTYRELPANMDAESVRRAILSGQQFTRCVNL